MPAGHPTDYNKKILKKTKDYIELCEDKGKDVNLPTIEGLAYELKVHKDTVYEWRKVHKEFSDLIGELLSKQAKRLVNSGLSGRYNPTIAKVLLTKHGYREGVEYTGDEGGPMRVDVTQALEKAYGSKST